MSRKLSPFIALVVLSLMLLGGCQFLQQNQSTVKLAVQYATLKVVEDHPERAGRIEEIVGNILDVLEDATVTVSDLEEAVKGQIDWDKLSPSDTLLVNSLISAVADELEKRVGMNVLNEEQTVKVREVMNWILEAARLG